MQRTKAIQVNEIVRVGKCKDGAYYKVISIAPDGFGCKIAEMKPDGSCYAAQDFDTSLLVKVSQP